MGFTGSLLGVVGFTGSLLGWWDLLVVYWGWWDLLVVYWGLLHLQESSRSHAVFTIIVEHATYDGTGGNTVTIGKLRLVDLAGSEK